MPRSCTGVIRAAPHHRSRIGIALTPPIIDSGVSIREIRPTYQDVVRIETDDRQLRTDRLLEKPYSRARRTVERPCSVTRTIAFAFEQQMRQSLHRLARCSRGAQRST